MSGTFIYTDTGLLDRTHLRFFDRRSAEALFTDAGLRIVERLRVRRGLTETEIPIDPSTVPPQIVQMLETDPEATTYQFVLAAVRSEGERVPEVVSLAELLQRRTEELEAQYRRLEEYARSLEERNRDQAEAVNRLNTQTTTATEELQRVRTELRSELEARLRELAQGHLELRHLRADLAVKEAFITELRSAADRARAEQEASTVQLRHRDAVTQELRQAADRVRVDQKASTAELQRRDAVIRELRLDVTARVDAQHRLAALQERLSATREALERLRVFANSAGFRIVASVAGSLSRYPRMYEPLRRLVRRVAGHLPPNSPTS
jgi:DNA repair exonuclease SbcCD ATPase subunit